MASRNGRIGPADAIGKPSAPNVEKPAKHFNSTAPIRRSPSQPLFNNVRKIVGDAVEDWMFLALLGTLMAILSMGMDLAIDVLQNYHIVLISFSDWLDVGWPATFVAWTLYTVLLVFLSACCAHFIAPQAIGSGIPEMKTILRGVILKEYLTGRTLIAKVVGLTLALGSGVPIGKEGPFVHIASILANLLSYFVKSFNSIYANESRSSEMLAAACAVGVSSTFSAPVGGVLFSIEVTSVYFAVRNYWRGFFASACSATLFRLFRVYLRNSQVTVVAFYQTYFPQEVFFPEELPAFAAVGVICGLLAAVFIVIHRRMVLFLRRNRFAKSVFQKHWMIYPIVASTVVATLTYPRGLGIFLAGEKRFSTTARDFFWNCTWTASMHAPVLEANIGNQSADNSIIKSLSSDDQLRYQRAASLACPPALLTAWRGNNQHKHSVFYNLGCFLVVFFFLSALMSTLPIPCGLFGPSFIIGAGVGRLIGELMALQYVEGLRGLDDISVNPGVYAVVGAAAFCGGVTRTISVAVIVFELTGQLTHIVPVMLAVLIANAICSYLQPSIYDSIIQLKHLPYLPDIPNSSSNFHRIHIEQFMTRTVRFLSKQSTYLEAQNLLHECAHLKAFPVVDSCESMILIGSCSRAKLVRALNAQAGPAARRIEAQSRVRTAIESAAASAAVTAGTNLSTRRSTPAIASEPTPWRKASDTTTYRSRCRPKSEDNKKNRKKFTIVSVVGDEMRRAELLSDTVAEFNARQAESQPSAHSNHERRGGVSMQGLRAIAADSINDLQSRTGMRAVVSENAIFESNKNNNNNSCNEDGHNSRKLARWLLSPQEFKSIEQLTVEQQDVHASIGAMVRSLTRISFRRLYKSSSDCEDLNAEERAEWERSRLAACIDFATVGVDPAPFQLVEHSSLFKIHSLFSLLALSRAYVTACGRLVGVVALRDLRIAIEKVQTGMLTPDDCLPLASHGPANVAVPSASDKSPIVTPVISSDADEKHDVEIGLSGFDSSEEDDIRNDMLTPCPEVVNLEDPTRPTVTKRRSSAGRRISDLRPLKALKEPLVLLGGLVSANSDAPRHLGRPMFSVDSLSASADSSEAEGGSAPPSLRLTRPSIDSATDEK